MDWKEYLGTQPIKIIVETDAIVRIKGKPTTSSGTDDIEVNTDLRLLSMSEDTRSYRKPNQ